MKVITYDSILSRSGRSLVEVTPAPGETLAELVATVARGRGWTASGSTATLNGSPVPREGWDLPLSPDDEVIVARSPGDPVTGILIGIAIISAAASAYLVSRVKAPRIGQNSGREQERFFRFGRFSQPAVVGDAQQVVFGERRVGGKIIHRRPIESVDGSGDSKLRMLIDLSWGRVEAIGNQTADADAVDASVLSGIELNDQPIANFTGAKAWVRMGTVGQAVIPGFSDAEILREVGVGGVEMRNTSGVERTGGSASGEAFLFSTLASVNAVTIRCRFPALYSVSDAGQIDTGTAKYRYRTRTTDIGAGAGAWSAWTVVELTRADQSEFYSSPRVDLATLARHDVQLERVSVEPASASLVNKFFWDSVVETTTGAYTYPNKALLALELTAGEQLQAQPEVSVVVKGVRCRVWDGVSDPSSPVFVTQYTRNPFWQALEVLTNETWGMGATYSDANIDFANWCEEAPFADSSVPRPGGGTRSRYACDIVLDAQKDGVDWLRVILRVARATPVTVGGVWRVVADRVKTAVETFTDGSIAVDGEGVARFSYRRELATGGAQRPNRFLAQFDNALAGWQPETIAFPDYGAEWLATETPQEETIRLEGETDPDQVAARLVFEAKKARFLTRSVKFTTTKPVVAVQPGDRFDLNVSAVGWGLASGRVDAGCTASTVKLDRSVNLASGTTYVITIQHQDDSVETRTITSPAGSYPAGSALSISGTFATTPAEWEEYALGALDVNLKPFTCTGVAPTGGDSGGIEWEVSGIEYDDEVYDDAATTVTFPTYTTLTSGLTPPGPVTRLVATERTVGGVNQVELAWTQTPEDAQITASFRIYRRRSFTTVWVLVPEPRIARRGAVIEIKDDDTSYDFAVIAVSVGGACLSPDDPRVPKASAVFGFGSLTIDPPASASLARQADGTYTLSWAAVAGAVQYAVLVAGAGPDTTVTGGTQHAMVLARTSSTQLAGLTLAPGRSVTFYVRSVASNARMSFTAASVTLASPLVKPGQSVKNTTVFTLASDGTRTNLTWDAGESRLELTAAGTPGVWESQEINTGSLTLTEISFRAQTSNNAEDPSLLTDPFRVPSVAADQWGIIDAGTLEVGMMWPPYEDTEVRWLFEVKTFDGTVWSDWTAVAPGGAIRRVFSKYHIRATLTRLDAPYQPALASVAAVCTH